MINSSYNTFDREDEGVTPEFNDIYDVLTRGLIKDFPDHTKRLFAGNLTSFYSVLHKSAIRNWTLSTNTIVATRPHVYVLYFI